VNLSRYLREHRPAVILAVIVLCSFASLISGTEASLVQNGAKKAVAVTAYPFLKAKNFLARTAAYAFGFAFNYDTLRDEHASLQAENLRLKAALAQNAEVRQENERLRAMINFARETPRLTLEPAEVLECYKGMLRIDRGSFHGMEESMAVLSHEGVVGIITEVGFFTSVVATLHHPECKIGAMVQRNRLRAYDGVVHAAGSDLNRICTMEYIDMKNEVRVGDVVVTSPESVFPSGCFIGIVSAPPQGSGSLWKTAEISPAVNPYRLDEVFVVRRAVVPMEEMAAAAPPAATPRNEAAAAPPVPDERPIQERYAP